MCELTYRGDAALKARLVERALAHQAADRYLQGTYFDDGLGLSWKGCAVGCTVVEELAAEYHFSAWDIGVDRTLYGEWHITWARVTGLPEWLARIDDIVFEELDEHVAPSWPAQLFDAVPVGVNLDEAREALTRDLVFDTERGVIGQVTTHATNRADPLAAAHLRALSAHAPWPVLAGLVAELRKTSRGDWASLDALIHLFGGGDENRLGFVAGWIDGGNVEWVADRIVHHLQRADVVE